MNGWVWVGIIVIAIGGAVGTILINYGNSLDASRSSIESKAAIDSISRDLAELRNRPKSQITEEAVERVQGDVDSWAKEFASNKERRELAFKQEQTEHDQALRHANDLARGYTNFFIVVLRDALDSFARHAALKVTYDLPDVPSNLYDDPTANYHGSVTFGDDRRWAIRAWNPSASTGAPGPWVNVDLVVGKDSSQKSATFFFRISPDAKSYSLILRGEFAAAYTSPTVHPTMEDFESSIRGLVKAAVENERLKQA